MKNISRKLKIIIISLSLSLGLVGSFGFVDNYFEISKNLDIFATLFRELNIYYVDETDPGKLIKKGVDSMLESLDPYTNFISESEIEDYRFMTTGQYGGIGALIQQHGENIVVRDPYEGFPAQKNDLRAGDIILEIDGKSTVGKKTDDVSKILKGTPQTPVKLLIERVGEKKPFEKVIVRDEIKVKSVPYFSKIDEGVGYIKLSSFTENASGDVKKALTELKTQHKIQGVVLDLRGNPGGLLHEAINIVNLFVEKGREIVTTHGKVKEWDKSYKSENIPVDSEIPIVVLVNSGSASASEIVSGALQDLDRGVVVGQRTFGKGLVQATRQLTYNTQLKVTTAKYYIPSGRCIQALDYSHRNEDGSVGKIPDSLMREFKTKGGRTVKDGGGILPDVVMEPNSLSLISQSLISKSLLFDYATHYRVKNESIPKVGEFKLPETEFSALQEFLKGKEYSYTSKTEKALNDLKEQAEKEKTMDRLSLEFNQLKDKILEDKKSDLAKNKNEISRLLKEEIVSRYYFQTGRAECNVAEDPEVKRAVALLKDKSEYDSILARPVAKKSSSK